ncbi:hypothetical protein K6119_00140 [Paracrocinitomix mangrovi]|uniref:hypothetical protein n=1 Tax=Paracrocinitomix mangrovi TaxID=2862509 RepID=UPI001C8D98E6|nr:hypothetical protein [Paracrocinitomix mangrovi]UKN01924.1 hypothetical protein K6119_00140 [Paracrocinitomix mangrovi]
MKNVILKVPYWLFTLAIFTPLIVWKLGLLGPDDDFLWLMILLIPPFVGTIWGVGVADYMCAESKDYKPFRLIILLYLLFITLSILSLVLPESRKVGFIFYLATLIDLIFIGLLQMKLIGKVFYARSAWYVFIEIVAYPIGMMTLTPTIIEWEKGGKFEKDDEIEVE